MDIAWIITTHGGNLISSQQNSNHETRVKSIHLRPNIIYMKSTNLFHKGSLLPQSPILFHLIQKLQKLLIRPRLLNFPPPSPSFLSLSSSFFPKKCFHRRYKPTIPPATAAPVNATLRRDGPSFLMVCFWWCGAMSSLISWPSMGPEPLAASDMVGRK